MSIYPSERREVLLTIDHVDADRGDRPVLRDVDVTIRNVVRPDVTGQGQVVGVLGPSGVGKTTLFRILAGLDAPARGRVLVGAAQEPVRPGRVGVVGQAYPLFEHRSVLGNLRVAARRRGWSRTRIDDEARALLARFELADRADAWPAELSGGERQRVAIAQQLLCGHTFILLDEPFSGLDPRNRARTCALIAEVAGLAEHNTVVVVTHDLRDAVKVADTLWLLDRDPAAPDGGSTIVATYDLVERGLAWHAEIDRTPAFAALVRELEDRFATS
jgi:polar amino acid transport system ATP-binding protein/sulfate transport system ATP-binding protein